ncbi:MAG TPA: PIN-like domain-containing protein, partial [Isosphaeraceae bacterium]|nr:PIN-like domain-containing protein [Isosphaeraceae bacterium]
MQPKSRTELLYALKKAKPYLWCPNHIAREFLTSRPGVITEYRNWHKDISAKLASAIEKAFEKLDTTPYVQTLAATVRGAMEGVYGTVKLYGDQYDCTVHKDPVLTELTAIYESRIGEPYPSSALAEKLKEAKRRVASGMPPGLKDAEEKIKRVTAKDDPQALMIENVFGDVLIWFQIMDYCKAGNVTDLTLVTEDKKEGEWVRNHDGRFPVGPRTELLEELYANSQTRLHVIPTSTFFRSCQESFKLDMADAVQEISEVERAYIRTVDKVTGTVAKQTLWFRRDLYVRMPQLCHPSRHEYISNLNPDEIALVVDSEFLPRVLNSDGLSWRFHTLVRAIKNERGVDDHTGILQARDVVRRCLIDYF